MDRIIKHGPRHGAVRAPVSKSALHRLMICASLSGRGSAIECGELPGDAEATLRCLAALGAGYAYDGKTLRIDPIVKDAPLRAELHCGESAATLRFMLPLCGVLGTEGIFYTEGRLGERPLDGLISELEAHGMRIEREMGSLRCSGSLAAGDWSVPGDVSSQFVSALLLALPHLSGDSTLRVTGRIESAGYIAMTERTLRQSSVRFEREGATYRIPGGQLCELPRTLAAEGDWSGAAPFLAMGALSQKGLCVTGLDASSPQPDRGMSEILRDFGAEVFISPGRAEVRQGGPHGCVIDASQRPDLVPSLAALAALSQGETRIINASRLRLKESDRLECSAAMLRALGADIEPTRDALIIRGRAALRGGETEAFSDHRIAMAAAVAACGCENDVILHGAECVSKSFPRFWDELDTLGG